MKLKAPLFAGLAGTIIGATGIASILEKAPEPTAEPIIEITIPPTEQILALEKEMKEREEAGLSTTIIFQKIQEIKQQK